MPVPLVALLGAAIYQARSPLADPDPDPLSRALGLLVRAAGGGSVRLEVGGTDLNVNGVPVSLATPGATLIRQALVDQATAKLVVPATATIDQWREIIELYASAPGLYGSVDDLRDALRTRVPDITVSGAGGAAAEGDLREALFELPGLKAQPLQLEPRRAPDPHGEELTQLTARLDPLLQAAAAARDSNDYAHLAQVLLQLRELEDRSNDELRSIVARERRRVAPSAVLERMARLIPKPGSPVAIANVLGSLGREGIAALFNALSGAPGPTERRAYIDALVDAHDGDEVMVEMLGNKVPRVMRDAAEIAGRRRIERAVPPLVLMLKHPEVEVRTASWHALERIGTPAARKALRN